MNPNDLSSLIDNWCPKGPHFDHEDTSVRLVRALMTANACVMQHEMVARGETPIRLLSSLPKAYVGR